jgi:hypothetical protein
MKGLRSCVIFLLSKGCDVKESGLKEKGMQSYKMTIKSHVPGLEQDL